MLMVVCREAKAVAAAGLQAQWQADLSALNQHGNTHWAEHGGQNWGLKDVCCTSDLNLIPLTAPLPLFLCLLLDSSTLVMAAVA